MELELFKNILKYIKNNEKDKRSLLTLKYVICTVFLRVRSMDNLF